MIKSQELEAEPYLYPPKEREWEEDDDQQYAEYITHIYNALNA